MTGLFLRRAAIASAMAGLLTAGAAQARPGVSKAAGLSQADLDQWARGPQPDFERELLFKHALAAPQRRVSGKTHYCIDDRWTDAQTPRRVCRTLGDWHRLGLDPSA